MKIVSVIILLFTTTIMTCWAQSTYTAKIQTVTKSDYYNIELSQEIIALSKDFNFSNIRINDSKNNEIPYLVRSENPVKEINQFVSYKLLQNSVKDSLNILIVENESQEDIEQFYISIVNADVSKYVRLRGSNDLKQWYIVKQQENISYSGFKQGNNEILILNFPKGNYKYYEIVLSNTQGSPLKIQQVGKFKNSNIYAQLAEIDLGTFVQKDSTDKKTYIHFPDLPYDYRINKLWFKVKSKGVYLRECYIDGDYKIYFQLSSKSDNTIFVNGTPLSPKRRIVIENNDNLPLQIDSIKAYGLNRYLCAYLEAGHNYTLAINDNQMQAPNYDIQNFQNDIPQNLEIIRTSDLTKIDTPPAGKREKIWIEKPLVLWSIIIAIGLFLSFICVRMIKEMKNKK